MMKKWILLILAGFLGVFLFASCGTSSIPEPKGYVNDFANLISDDAEKSIELQLTQYEKQTSNEIAVVTVKTIGSDSIEDYAIKLAEEWKVGKKDKDNGVIILVAKEEKKIRIEVGYGLEQVLTDAKSKLIIEREISPRFKAGDFAGGIQAGVNAVIGTIGGSYELPADLGGEFPALLLITLFIVGGLFLLIIIAIIATGGMSGGGGGYWSSGGSSGGSGGGGSFGGGSFGGGGASGSW